MSKRGGPYWVVHGPSLGGGPWTVVSEMFTPGILLTSGFMLNGLLDSYGKSI